MIIWSLCRLDQKGLLCSYLLPFRSIVANEQTTTVNIRTYYMIYKDILIPSLSKSTETYHRKEWGAGTGTGICVLSPPDTFLSQFMGQYYSTYRRVRGIGVVSHCLLPGCYHYTSSASNGQTVSGEFCMVLPHHFSEFTEVEYRWGWFTAAWIAEKDTTY